MALLLDHLPARVGFYAKRWSASARRSLVPDLAQGNFEHLTITGQLGVIEETVAGQPAALVGSSMGGYLAALFAAGHSEITRLVLLAPAFGFARRWPERLGVGAVEAWRRSGSIEVFHYADNRQRRLSYALLEDGMRYEDYPAFPQPALIFHGLHDDVVLVEYSRQFVPTTAMPAWRLWIQVTSCWTFWMISDPKSATSCSTAPSRKAGSESSDPMASHATASNTRRK